VIVMRVLIDTNIFIHRENYHVIPNNLQSLLKTLNKLAVQILIHPLSLEEVKRDKKRQRSEIIQSKIKTYPLLDDPPDPQIDENFLAIVGQHKNIHDIVDNNLLYCLYKNAIDFLITEDRGIHRKAEKLGISDRVFDINESFEYFKKHLLVENVPKPPALKYVPVYTLDIKDPIFTPLKEEYGHTEFTDWWEKISREGRKSWVYFKEDNKLGAILILKIEDEPIPSIPLLPRKRRVKICTFKASYTGYKIGELFIKISVAFAIRNNIDELYLTHFIKPDDYLVELIENFGFYRVAKKGEEDVFIKKLIPDRKITDPIEISKKFYPCFYDGEKVKKFIIPIRPEYHNKLFTDYQPRQPSLFEFGESGGELIIEGNTIKKAYLCHSRIKEIRAGDILLFYRSVDERKITSLGIIERVYHNVMDPNEIARCVGKRSVYSKKEFEEIAKKPTKIILFRHHLHLENPLPLNYLKTNHILRCAPQSIVEISHENYLMIKRDGGINEGFTVN